MALHPTGADVLREAESGGHNAMVLGVLGLILGVAAVLIGGTGLLPLDIHGFGAVVLGQAAWMLWMARVLTRSS